jgi:hypothetical protein
MLEKYSLLWLKSTNKNLIHLLDDALVPFGDIVHSCLNMNFAGGCT